MKKGRILIAEDDHDVAMTLTEGLESFQYTVVEIIARGEDLAQAVKKHQPDLILADIFLAGSIDAIEATAALLPSKTPIIFLTGGFTIELVARMRDHQNAMLLYKPCKIIELVGNIELALERQTKGQTAFADLFATTECYQSEDFRKQLGLLIKSVRKEYQMTQAHAAEKLCINYRYFQDIEAGKANLKIDTLFKIIKGLNLVD